MSDSDLKYMSITLDRENQTFKAGDLVSGKVVAEFRQPTKVRGKQKQNFLTMDKPMYTSYIRSFADFVYT